MTHRLSLSIACLATLAGCTATAPRPTAPSARGTSVPVTAASAAPKAAPDDNLNAVAWTQTAIEHDLIFEEVYSDAQAHLAAALKDPHWDALAKADRAAPLAKGMRPAVVLDVDETVLDNAPYQAQLIKRGGEFNEADWAAWCRAAKARALPGVVAYATYAARHGVQVLYVSNRAKDLDQPTLANLRAVGMPVSGPEAFLGLGTFVEGCEQAGTEKGCRRRLISRRYRVLQQVGDQIGDFADVLANTPDGRAKAMAPYRDWIGSRWFVLPNPTYGSWQPALFDNDFEAPRDERRQKTLNSLRYH